MPAQAAYSTNIFVDVPAGTYKAAVYWRPSASAAWVLTPKSAWFTVTP